MNRNANRGFTLLELVIALAIVGILATLALPSYQAYVYRAKAVEVILLLDKIKTALATHEMDRNARLGSELFLVGSPTAVTTRTSMDAQNPGSQRVGDLRPQELDLARLGIRVLLQSGNNGTTKPGQYRVSLFWTPSRPGQEDLARESRQIALAVADVMKPHAQSVTPASAVVSMIFQLPGATTTSGVTAPQPATTSTTSTPPATTTSTTTTTTTPTTTTTSTPPSTTTQPPMVVTPPPLPGSTSSPASAGTGSGTNPPAVQQGNPQHPGNHGQGFAKGHSK